MFTRSKKKREEEKLRSIRSSKEALKVLQEESEEDSHSSIESLHEPHQSYTELEPRRSTNVSDKFTESEDTLPFASKIKSDSEGFFENFRTTDRFTEFEDKLPFVSKLKFDPEGFLKNLRTSSLKSEDLEGEQKLLESERIQQLIAHNNELLNALRLANYRPIQDPMALAPEVLDAITRIGKTSISISDLPIFQADENESIHTFFHRYEHIATFNRWTDEDKARTLPLCLRQQVLTFFEGLPAVTRANYQLAQQAIRDQFATPELDTKRKAELYTMKQGSRPLNEFLREFDRKTHELQVNEASKIDLLAALLKPKLAKTLLQNRPATYNDAVRRVTVKNTVDSTDTSNETLSIILGKLSLLEEKQAMGRSDKDSKRVDHTQVVKKRPKRINYAEPAELARENNRLRQKLDSIQKGHREGPVNMVAPFEVNPYMAYTQNEYGMMPYAPIHEVNNMPQN